MSNYAIMSDELYHHGIKGQKWGVRRFQNSDGSLTSAGRQRYGYSKGYDGSSNSLLSKAKNNAKNNLKNKIANETKADLPRTTPDTGSKKNKILNSKVPKGSFGELSPETSEALASVASAVAVSVAARLALRAAVKASFNTMKNAEKNENKKDNPFSDVKKTKPAAKKEDDMKKINPDFGKKQGSTMNCTLCTTAYEMRRRGYDVTANFSSMGRDLKDISSFYKNTTKKDWVNSKKGEQNIMKAFDSMPDGSRGNVCAQVGKYGSRHSMVWEKENGKIIIRDCQSNKTYDSNNLFMKNGSSGIVRSDRPLSILRTDNREINTDNVMDAIRPVGK